MSHHVRDGVRQVRRDAVTGRDPRACHIVRETIHARVEGGEGDALGAVAQRFALRANGAPRGGSASVASIVMCVFRNSGGSRS